MLAQPSMIKRPLLDASTCYGFSIASKCIISM
jgi:hypothetical protein